MSQAKAEPGPGKRAPEIKKVFLIGTGEEVFVGEFGSAEIKGGQLWINGRNVGGFLDEIWFFLSKEMADVLGCKQGPWTSVEIK